MLEFLRKTNLIILIILSTGCATVFEPTPIGSLYQEVAKTADIYSNPIIVIPGTIGSKLKDTRSGRTVWGAFEKNYANPETPDGARLIALPMKKGAKLNELRDDVIENGVLDRVKLSFFGVPLELRAYFNILSTLGAGGYRDSTLPYDQLPSRIRDNIVWQRDHFTCFQFPYDWRRDNVENSKNLNDFIIKVRDEIVIPKLTEISENPEVDKEIREHIQKRLKNGIKFDIVAHSMGGIVTRYFLRYGAQDLPEDGSLAEVNWAGADLVEKAILIGTPNAGSSDAFYKLVEGWDVGPFLPKYEAAILGTMPFAYQLLPRTRHKSVINEDGKSIDIFDPQVWKNMQWGLADPDQEDVISNLLPETKDSGERRKIALDHLEKSLKRAKQFQEALDKRSEKPDHLKLYLVAGDSVPTESVIEVNTKNGKISVKNKAPGDGTLTRASALMDDRKGTINKLKSPVNWDHVTFLFNDHLGLTKDSQFADNILYLLLEHPNTLESGQF